MKKYKLLENDTTEINGKTLYRIQALRSFGFVESGELGGYIEGEKNLSHDGDAWVADDACVYGNARVSEDAGVYGYSCVFGNAKIYGDASVCMSAWVYDNARVYGNSWVDASAKVYGNAEIYGEAIVTNKACVGGDAKVSNFVITLETEDHTCTILKEYIVVDYQIYTYEDCKNLTDDEIFKMYGQDYLVWWNKYKDVLLKIWELNYGGIDVKSQNIFE